MDNKPIQDEPLENRASSRHGDRESDDSDEGTSVYDTPTGRKVYDTMDRPGQGALGDVKGYHDERHP